MKERDNENGKFAETHGQSRTPEYRAWINMRDRCFRPGHKRYADYGGRGITVCERWSDFSVFLADVGRRPCDAFSIDRIDNEGNYEPGNVRWATAAEQVSNRRYAGHKISAALTGRPHHERLKQICECGLTTNAGPMKRHLNASGHTLIGECAASMLDLRNRSDRQRGDDE